MANDTVLNDEVLLMRDMARLFRTSPTSIRRRLQNGTFPITPLSAPGMFDEKWRWWGPTVRQWLVQHGQVPPPAAADAPREVTS